MAKKDTEIENKRVITASHFMLYVILLIYIAVSLTCVTYMEVCMVNEQYELVGQILVPCVSLVGTCSCAVVGFYTNKAAKENEIKLSNDRYRMRLELAKDIFKEYGNTLDENSVNLLWKLMPDESVSEISPMITPPTTTVNVPNIIAEYSDTKDSEEGLG